MIRSVLILSAAVCLTGPILSTGALASDGDVQYAAPYLWVDPETGQLVTKSREPQPKTHPEEPAPKASADNGSAATPAVGQAPVAGNAAERKADADSGTGSSLPAILAGSMVLLVIAVLLIRKLRRERPRTDITGDYAGEKGSS